MMKKYLYLSSLKIIYSILIFDSIIKYLKIKNRKYPEIFFYEINYIYYNNYTYYNNYIYYIQMHTHIILIILNNNK